MRKMNRATIAVAILTLAFGCKKDPAAPPDEPREPSEIISNIVGNLETADSISVFVDALKGLSLSATDVEEGITVFAPLNDEETQAQQALMMGKKPSLQAFETGDLTPTVLKDHIVKGVIKLTDLTNGRILVSLSGKEFKISRVGNKIWINGIQIGSEEIGTTADQVVYTVKELLSNTAIDDELQTTSLEVVVWDGFAWTPELKKGTVAVGAKVGLYGSQADFANDIVAYEAETDTEGKAVFSDIDPGAYFVFVEYGDKRNIFHSSMRDGVQVGMVPVGIFQSEQAVENAPLQPDAKPGNFQWLDINSDGIINGDDMMPIPYDNAEVKDGRVKTIEVFVGYGDNSAQKPLPPAEFEDALQVFINSMDGWRMRLAVTDAVLSGNIAWNSLTGRLANDNRPFGDFSFHSNEPAIAMIWSGYQLINGLNNLEPRTSDPVWAARLRLTRAYVYFQLMSYFGNVPLSQGVEQGKLNNSDPDAVYNFVKQELEEIEGVLPQDGGRIVGSKAAARALLARTALLRKDYSLAAHYTDLIINSGNIQLSSAQDKFDVLSPEYIWNVLSGFSDEIREFFFNRPSFPILRYSEVLLTGVEAKLALGDKATAIKYFNQLADRDGGSHVGDTLSNVEITDRLRSLWNTEMAREGTTFANYIRWGVAADSLGHRGFTPGKNEVLPIPTPVIEANPQMIPNGGY